jgi:ABC-type branched-subunit amino acid transport system substrate-binding protein
LKQLQAADIPFVGVGQGIAESAPNSYPIFGTDIPLLDIVSQFKADNIKTVNVLSVNFPASISTVSAILKPVWAKQGVTIGKSVFYTSGAADVTTPATQVIAGHPDAVYVINGPQDVVRTIQAIRQAGYTGRIFAGYSVETPSLFPAASKILTGVVNSTGQVLYFNDTSNPEVALMHKVLGGSIPVDSYSQSAVAQVLTLVDMGNKIGGELTGMKLLAYLKNIRNQKVFMGYQMDISDILPNVLALSHVTNTFDRFVTYNGTAFKYIGGWMSVSGIETPGAGAGS